MRSPIVVRRAAVGNSAWVPLNRLQQSFNVGLGVKFSSGGVLTVTVQHTFDDLWKIYTDFTIARVTVTATVTEVAHGLSVGDYINVTNAGAPLDGEFSVATVVDADNFTYTVANSGVAASAGIASLQKARVFDHLILAGITASADGNYVNPIVATRLRCSAYTSGFAELNVIQARG